MDGTKPAVEHDNYSDTYLRRILREVKTIAMVGASPNWNRPSFFAMKYLQQKGYRVIPVNPTVQGQKILGETVYASLEDIPETVDMVAAVAALEPQMAEKAEQANTVAMAIPPRMCPTHV